MRLIRLVTENLDGTFDNNFNANINIEPGSKIALSNISLESEQDTIIVDNTNDTISTQYTSGDIKSFQVAHATYTRSNYLDLLKEIERSANQTPADPPVEMGLQWKASVGNNRKIEIEHKQGALNENTSNWKLKNVSKTGTAPDTIWSSSVGTDTALYTNRMDMPFQWCKGSGLFRCRIHTLVNGDSSDTDGFTMGFTRQPPNITDDIPLGDIVWGIRTSRVFENYKVIVDGRLKTDDDDDVNTVVIEYGSANSSNNDIPQISVNEGVVQLKVHKQTGTNQIIYETPMPFSEQDGKLYAFIAFHGRQDNCKVKTVRVILDPYVTIPTNTQVDTYALVGFYPPSQSTIKTEQFLLFQGLSLANYLGFQNLRQPVSGFIKDRNIIYTANNIFQITELSDSFIVELMNINLMSYDGLSKQRRNILATIPATDNIINGQVIHEASNLIFLDIDNAFKTTLRNIKARLLKADLSPLSIKGLAVMTILIKDSNE